MANPEPNTPERPLTTEQRHYKALQGMLHGRRRLSTEERRAIDYACTIMMQEAGRRALDPGAD